MKAEEFENELRGGDIGPLYCIHGEEPYLVERGVKRLVEKAAPSDFREFNLTVFYGGEVKGDEVVETALTLPMFADRRVVLIKKSGALPAAALELLSGYVQDPSPSTCLIFQGEKIDQRKKLFQELKTKGRTVEYKRLYENQLGPFIRDEVAEKGKRIEPAAIEMLAYLVGNNLQELSAEIEKTAVYIGTREVIRIDDIRAAVSDTKVDSIFDLTNAIGEKNLVKSLRSLQTIVRDGEAPLMVLTMLTRHFRQLWRVKELVEKRMLPQEIGKAAGINPYFVKGLIVQTKGFAITDLRKIFEMFFAVDLAMKTGGGRPVDLMERLVMDICAQGRK